MTKLVLKEITQYYPEYTYALQLWQGVNRDVLALCPPRWAELTENQKWVLLRILARREEYVPDWIAPDIWASLKEQLMPASFETDTFMLNPAVNHDCIVERDYKQALSGKAPQSFREEP